LPQALALWDAVAADPSADKLLRGLATLLWTQHQLDKGVPGILEARLKPLAVPDNPWRPMAEEQLALLAVRQGHTAQAKDTLTALSHDVTAPKGVRERATAVLAQLQG
ncbi:MAG: tetratricopeptide repeat protein, partial [Acetobacteraceae bacterium]